jgi:hypothetical protein
VQGADQGADSKTDEDLMRGMVVEVIAGIADGEGPKDETSS